MSPPELDDATEPEHRHRELSAGGHALQDVADSPMIGGLAHPTLTPGGTRVNLSSARSAAGSELSTRAGRSLRR